MSDDLRDLPGLQTARADADPPRAAGHESPNRHEVRQPAALGVLVGMADLVTDRRTFSTDIAPLSHERSLKVDYGVARNDSNL
jgi:hypothetical protein